MTETSHDSHAPEAASDAGIPAANPPGFWMIVLGCGLAFLAPLGGFLGGTIWATGTDLSTLSFWLVGGLLIGGIGVLIAGTGGMRWMAARRHDR